MRAKFVLLFAILSLSFFLPLEEKRESASTDHTSISEVLADVEQCISPQDNFIDQSGRRGSSSTISTSYSKTTSVASRRSHQPLMAGVKLAIASLSSIRSYSYSCDFPFEHQPQRGLFFILHNIRI